MEILSPLATPNMALFPRGILDLKTTKFREGPLIEVVAESVSFPTNLTPPNLES